MLEWFSRWTPEHVIGFVTALGILISAWKLKGKAKTPEASPPTVDVEGMIHNVRLAQADREKLDDMLDSQSHLRRALSAVENDVLNIKANVVEIKNIARLIARQTKPISSTPEPETNRS